MHTNRRIGVLGPLEVRDAGGQLVPVGGAGLRSFLIRLAVSEGSPVPVDRLAEDLWPRTQPADVQNAIQALASRLRVAAGRDLIEHGPAGYRLAVPADQVYAQVFGQLVASGRRAIERHERPSRCSVRWSVSGRCWHGNAVASTPPGWRQPSGSHR
jgi:DNA-binding SARP family transcriptional activator